MAGKHPLPADDALGDEGARGELTPKMREYLVQVYRLCDREGQPGAFISTSAVADSRIVSAPAVNRMIGRLRDLGLVEHEPYKGIRLTQSGEQTALKQLRRHRIIEAFLVAVMGFGWHQVHDEADQMAPASTDALVDRMATMSGNPTHCPHGEPIPTTEGVIADMGDMLLVDAPLHTPLVLTRVRTREPDRLEYLQALELMPGALLEVHHAAPFHGPLQIKLEGTHEAYRIIGHNLAEMLRVRPAEQDSAQ
ncbi:MAG: metal-dependent transcriptional regulator [Chloroflexi bacterium]|nr:metal-dependent transcriptional regulator [Chloroflexota bacterium]